MKEVYWWHPWATLFNQKLSHFLSKTMKNSSDNFQTKQTIKDKIDSVFSKHWKKKITWTSRSTLRIRSKWTDMTLEMKSLTYCFQKDLFNSTKKKTILLIKNKFLLITVLSTCIQYRLIRRLRDWDMERRFGRQKYQTFLSYSNWFQASFLIRLKTTKFWWNSLISLYWKLTGFCTNWKTIMLLATLWYFLFKWI